MHRYDLSFITLGITEHSDIVPKTLFEIGSRDGHDMAFMRDFFKVNDENCFIFEPNPSACESIIKTYPKFKTYNNAISTKTGVFPFTINHDNIGASSLLTVVEPLKNSTVIEVDCIDMKSVMESENIQSIDVCKIDVEGATLDVLKSFGNLLSKVKSIQVECEHKEIWKGQSLYNDVKELLEANGFIQEFFCLLRNCQSDTFWIRKEHLIL